MHGQLTIAGSGYLSRNVSLAQNSLGIADKYGDMLDCRLLDIDNECGTE